MITLLRGGWVAAWDGSQHCIIERGEVAFQDEADPVHILYAGPQYDGQAAKVIDGPEWVICPGFITLHGHVGVELMSSVIDVPRSGRLVKEGRLVQGIRQGSYLVDMLDFGDLMKSE
jgi:cytosine/adenosine deaminase-related metal-dependent hydrolase